MKLAIVALIALHPLASFAVGNSELNEIRSVLEQGIELRQGIDRFASTYGTWENTQKTSEIHGSVSGSMQGGQVGISLMQGPGALGAGFSFGFLTGNISGTIEGEGKTPLTKGKIYTVNLLFDQNYHWVLKQIPRDKALGPREIHRVSERETGVYAGYPAICTRLLYESIRTLLAYPKALRTRTGAEMAPLYQMTAKLAEILRRLELLMPIASASEIESFRDLRSWAYESRFAIHKYYPKNPAFSEAWDGDHYYFAMQIDNEVCMSNWPNGVQSFTLAPAEVEELRLAI